MVLNRHNENGNRTNTRLTEKVSPWMSVDNSNEPQQHNLARKNKGNKGNIPMKK